MSETSKAFSTANQLVSFDKDSLGGFYIHSWHPSKTSFGAYGLDSRVLTLVSLEGKCFTLQTPVVDSIGTLLMKGVTTGDDDRMYANATVIEMFALASSIPNFEKQYKAVSEIPVELIQAASEDIKLYLYSSQQTIQSLGEPDFDDTDGVTTLSMPIQLGQVVHDMEIEISGNWIPHSLTVPAIQGMLHLEFSDQSYQGGRPSVSGLTIKLPHGSEVTLSDEHLSMLAMTGELLISLADYPNLG
jgi:hypothetical protein